MALPLYAYLVGIDMGPIFVIWLVSAIFFVCHLKPSISKVAVQIIKVYSSSFELEAEAESSNSSQVIELSGYTWLSLKLSDSCKVHYPRIVIGMLIFLIYCIWASTVAIFWDKAMLTSKIDECIVGDGFDCFRRDSRLQSLPLDCATFNESVSIICYKIRVDFPRGVAEAGGVPVTSATIFLTVAKAIFYIKLYLKKCFKKCGCTCDTERFIVKLMATLQMLLLIGMLGGIIGALTISPLWNHVRSNGAKLMSTSSIALTIYAIIWIPWYLCYFEVVDQKEKKNVSTD